MTFHLLSHKWCHERDSNGIEVIRNMPLKRIPNAAVHLHCMNHGKFKQRGGCETSSHPHRWEMVLPKYPCFACISIIFMKVLKLFNLSHLGADLEKCMKPWGSDISTFFLQYFQSLVKQNWAWGKGETRSTFWLYAMPRKRQKVDKKLTLGWGQGWVPS